MPRIIFHIDVNSAFLSWSAVKLVMEGKPDIRLVPSVVSGDPNDRRSIITIDPGEETGNQNGAAGVDGAADLPLAGAGPGRLGVV